MDDAWRRHGEFLAVRFRDRAVEIICERLDHEAPFAECVPGGSCDFWPDDGTDLADDVIIGESLVDLLAPYMRTDADFSDAVIRYNRDNPLSDPGINGVSWSVKAGKWQARNQVDGRQRWLGYHDTLASAACAVETGKAFKRTRERVD